MLTAVAVFAAATGVIVLVGSRMARTADRLATATGLGGALFGVVFLALATDLPEVTLTPAAVLSGSPRIAIGGLLGSAAAQLTLIAVVDIAFRKKNLYGRVPLAASTAQCVLMLAVLFVPLLVAAGSPTFGWVSAGTVLMALAYVGVLAAIRGTGRGESAAGPDQHIDASEAAPGGGWSLRSLWLRFGVYALLLAGAGVALETATETIGSGMGIGHTAAGALLAGVATSLPELVTAVSAARAGALELAVGDIVGSSALDVALLSLADVFYTEGSAFELLGEAEFTIIGVALALITLLVLGLVRRKPGGQPGVGVESVLMLVVYVTGAAILLGA